MPTNATVRSALQAHYGAESSYIGAALHDIKTNRGRDVKRALNNAQIGVPLSDVSSFLKREFKRLVTLLSRLTNNVTEKDLIEGPPQSVDFLNLYVSAKKIWEENVTLEQLKKLICTFVEQVSSSVSWLLSMIYSLGTRSSEDDTSSDVYDEVRFHETLFKESDIKDLRQVKEEVSACERFLDASGSLAVSLVRWVARLFITPFSLLKDISFRAMQWAGTYISTTFSAINKYLDDTFPQVKVAKRHLAHLTFFSTSLIDLVLRRFSAGKEYVVSLLPELIDRFKTIMDSALIAVTDLFSWLNRSTNEVVTSAFKSLTDYIKATRVWRVVTGLLDTSSILIIKFYTLFNRYVNLNMLHYITQYPIQFLFSLTSQSIQETATWAMNALPEPFEILPNVPGSVGGDDYTTEQNIRTSAELATRLAKTDKDRDEVERTLKEYDDDVQEYAHRQATRLRDAPVLRMTKDIEAAWEASGVVSQLYIGRDLDQKPFSQDEVNIVETYLGESAEVLQEIEQKRQNLQRATYNVFAQMVFPDGIDPAAAAPLPCKPIGADTRRRRRTDVITDPVVELVDDDDGGGTTGLELVSLADKQMYDFQQHPLAITPSDSRLIDVAVGGMPDMTTSDARKIILGQMYNYKLQMAMLHEKHRLEDESKDDRTEEEVQLKARLLAARIRTVSLLSAIGIGLWVWHMWKKLDQSFREANRMLNGAYFESANKEEFKKKTEKNLLYQLVANGEGGPTALFEQSRDTNVQVAQDTLKDPTKLQGVLERLIRAKAQRRTLSQGVTGRLVSQHDAIALSTTKDIRKQVKGVLEPIFGSSKAFDKILSAALTAAPPGRLEGDKMVYDAENRTYEMQFDWSMVPEDEFKTLSTDAEEHLQGFITDYRQFSIESTVAQWIKAITKRVGEFVDAIDPISDIRKQLMSYAEQILEWGGFAIFYLSIFSIIVIAAVSLATVWVNYYHGEDVAREAALSQTKIPTLQEIFLDSIPQVILVVKAATTSLFFLLSTASALYASSIAVAAATITATVDIAAKASVATAQVAASGAEAGYYAVKLGYAGWEAGAGILGSFVGTAASVTSVASRISAPMFVVATIDTKRKR